MFKMYKIRSGLVKATVIFATCSLASNLANAECFKGQGMAEEQWADITEPTEKMRKKAEAAATDQAWGNFIKSLNVEEQLKYSKAKQEKSDQSYYSVITQVEKISDKFSEWDKKYTLNLCITIDREMFNTLAKLEPDIPPSGEGSLIVGLFVARKASSSTEYDARRFEKSITNSNASIREKANIQGNSVSEETSKYSENSSDSGGSTTRKADKISYEIVSSEPVDNAINSVLTKSGYELIPYDEVAGECNGVTREEISQTFQDSNEILSAHWNSARKAARECEIAFFATGSMTADVGRNHPSGSIIVYVRVRGAVYDVSKRFSKKIATIPELQTGGMGPNETVARSNALKKAGVRAANEIAKLLKKKRIS